jgi:catechol 2,3-dioxygenase-like lactoylglutathione lyase family enzyme
VRVPVTYAFDVDRVASFWGLLGFRRHVQLPPDGEPVILREAEDMPWGERIATVADPEGNPVALCQAR